MNESVDWSKVTTTPASPRATTQLQALGQSLWLDGISRALISSGTLAQYIDSCAVTGLTSNPTIFDHAIGSNEDYGEAIRKKAADGKFGEILFFELALEDLRQAADLLRPVHDATNGVDGWVSLEVSPLLARDAQGTIKSAIELHAQAQRPNLFIKIPGTPEGIPAVEESIFAGVPINVTLLFSPAQYRAAAEAYMRGIERRIQAGRDPCSAASVASIFVSRWDKAVADTVSGELRNRLGIAIGERTYRDYRELLNSARWKSLASAGASPQRLLFASTGTKDPDASDTLYVEALAAPDTINTMPETTLCAFADHGRLLHGVLAADSDDSDAMLARFGQAGVDVDALALTLQRDGAQSFVDSWTQLLQRIVEKSGVPA